LNSELEEQVKQVRKSLEFIEYKPEDRLDLVSCTFKARDIIVGATMFLNRFADPEQSAQCDVEDLKLIHGHFCESARPLLEMLKHFHDRIAEEIAEKAEHNPFAT